MLVISLESFSRYYTVHTNALLLTQTLTITSTMLVPLLCSLAYKAVFASHHHNNCLKAQLQKGRVNFTHSVWFGDGERCTLQVLPASLLSVLEEDVSSDGKASDDFVGSVRGVCVKKQKMLDGLTFSEQERASSWCHTWWAAFLCFQCCRCMHMILGADGEGGATVNLSHDMLLTYANQKLCLCVRSLFRFCTWKSYVMLEVESPWETEKVMKVLWESSLDFASLGHIRLQCCHLYVFVDTFKCLFFQKCSNF